MGKKAPLPVAPPPPPVDSLYGFIGITAAFVIACMLATRKKKVRTFSPAEAKGKDSKKEPLDPKKAAVVFIEYQNEFTTPGGKLHDAVKGVMAETDMLQKSARVAAEARKAGMKVIHAPISFAEDASDNPNKKLGILAGCADGKFFTKGTWGAAFCDSMRPLMGDVVVTGKKGLDAFPGTDLESILVDAGVETVALAGFLTNCCVESTMRTAYEKGFNVVTLTDCTACTSFGGQSAAAGPTGTYSMFSTMMTAAEFKAKM